MNIRQEIEAGKPAKVSAIAEAMGVSSSLIYLMISRKEIEAKRIGQRRLVIPNAVARKLLDMEAFAA